MLQKSILGAALLVLGAVPSWCAYVPVYRVSDYQGTILNASLASDGVVASSCTVDYDPANNLFGYLPASIKSPSAFISGTCYIGTQSLAVSVWYSDDTRTILQIPVSNGVPFSYYFNLDSARSLRYPSYSFQVGVQDYIQGYCHISELQFYYPQNQFSLEISTDAIASLLSNTTFETTITSISAVSNLADFVTFAPNSDGGKAAFLFGCVLAFAFIVGIKATA